jgi:hypothetical protein
MPIAGRQLCDAYLTAAMLHYFRKKLSKLTEVELRIRIEETLKFLVISNHCDGAIPVSRDIDEIWHYWILQTQEYEALCLSLPDGKFIHHTSNDYIEYFDRDIGKHDNLPLDVKMLATYVANYGPFEKSRVKYWLLASHLVEKRGWDIQELNDWLASGTRMSRSVGAEVGVRQTTALATKSDQPTPVLIA